MPDGSTNIIAPSLEIAKAFWALFSPGDAQMRLRFVHTNKTAGKWPKECWGTLEEVWDAVIDYTSRGYETYFFPNKVKDGPGSGVSKKTKKPNGMATDRDVIEVRCVF